ncbi:hypothetical protein [Pseudobacteriovorax antillogorgiicola]|uniref:Uncharacterized protein n=1 Tax=Pseudobacteriovorax antillogorgiicola TaxID=1513793 RepID=A0A1Y6BJ84_9BACT|nr:hypothetical protein [Pseudobacteriovorax antillogorgiicola]TCS55386.1 hypothetical protein EDD56_105107 [Pseudobacteriovorax antillogorgiicola]SMF13185.1 hypothetical protein SAMN06296036_105217 [Pseudobacteriovorax antillogorgiicola]
MQRHMIFTMVWLLTSCFGSKQGEISRREPGKSQTDQPAKVPEPQEADLENEGSELEFSGEDYFEGQVVAAFNQCKRCHAGPKIPVERDRGPTTIFNYQAMLTLLDQNTLLPMLRGEINERPHPSNDPCLAGLNSSPCKEVAFWWDIEYGEIAEKENQRPAGSQGNIVDISRDGVITGWAINPSSINDTVDVNLYINNALVQTIPANQDIFDNDNPGAHGFQMTLANTYRNGQSFNLSARVVIDGDELELAGSPQDFAALPKQAAGRTYFDTNVEPLVVANCGCHGRALSYDYSWDRLANPLTTQGGGATDNRFYDKAAGQVQHAGGNACSGNQTCDQIVAWWQIEFGG